MLHRHLFKRYFIVSLLFIIGVLIGFFLLWEINTTFRIKNVEAFGVTTEERKTILVLFNGMSTLTFHQTIVKDAIQSRYPAIIIKDSHIQFPNTLILVVEKEKPEVYLKTDHGYLALSKTGVILKKERSSDTPFPFITFYQPILHLEYQVGQNIGFSAIIRAIQFVSILKAEGYQVETVAIDSVDMIACKTRGFEVVFSQTRPIDLQAHEVKQIIRQIKVGALRIGRLDLRFDKPVVQLPQK